MDQEYKSPCGKWGVAKNKQLRTDMVKAFLDVLQDAGYYAALYSSTDWLQNWVFDNQLTKYDKWVAQYASKCTYMGDYGMWQHHGDIPGFIGRCDGISVPVDLNDCYKDYPRMIKNHLLNGWTKADLQDKPDSIGTTITFLQARELLKAAGITKIIL